MYERELVRTGSGSDLVMEGRMTPLLGPGRYRSRF